MSKVANRRVIQACRDLSLTGGGRVVIETTRELQRLGWDVEIFTDYYNPASIDFDVKVTTLRFAKSLYEWRPKSRLLGILRHFLQMLNCMSIGSVVLARRSQKTGAVVLNHNVEYISREVIVAHNVFSAELTQAIHRSKKARLRVFNPVALLRVVRERFLFKRTRHLIAVSAACAAEAEPFTGRRTAIHIINNGVSLSMFCEVDAPAKAALRAGFALSEEDFVLLFVGHEFKRKGLTVVIEALPLLPANVKLIALGGRGDKQQEYVDLAERLGVRASVQFLGTLPNTVDFYRAADLFVLPTEYEAYPLVGLEALASGLPVLMTNVGGIADYLKDGINGFFIDRDPKDVATKVGQLLADTDLLTGLRANARSSALHHGWKTAAVQYQDVIQQV